MWTAGAGGHAPRKAVVTLGGRVVGSLWGGGEGSHLVAQNNARPRPPPQERSRRGSEVGGTWAAGDRTQGVGKRHVWFLGVGAPAQTGTQYLAAEKTSAWVEMRNVLVRCPRLYQRQQ